MTYVVPLLIRDRVYFFRLNDRLRVPTVTLHVHVFYIVKQYTLTCNVIVCTLGLAKQCETLSLPCLRNYGNDKQATKVSLSNHA